MGKRGALVAFLLCLAPVASSAQQAPCGPTGAVEKRIHDQYGETIAGAGMSQGNAVFTLVNPTTGTWTILMRRPDGMTCVLMGGTGYAMQDPIKPGTDL